VSSRRVGGYRKHRKREEKVIKKGSEKIFPMFRDSTIEPQPRKLQISDHKRGGITRKVTSTSNLGKTATGGKDRDSGRKTKRAVRSIPSAREEEGKETE